MLIPKHLQKAPIVEAAIQIDFTPNEGTALPHLLKLKPRINTTFPDFKEVKSLVSKIDLSPEGTSSSTTTNPVLIGYQAFSADKFFVAQMRPELFLFSRLRPYTGWEHFSQEAQKLWSEFAAVISENPTIKKIGLRFVNRFEIVLPAATTDYLSTPPKIPEGLIGQQVSGFMGHLNMFHPETSINSTIVQFLEPHAKPEFVSVILDIHVAKNVDFQLDEMAIWSTLQLLRETKNKIFFASITEKSYQMFE